MNGDDRRIAEMEKWSKLDKHMAAQTVHGAYTGKRLDSIEKSLNGTDVKALRDKVSEHSTTINRAKGGIAAVFGLWTFVKGLPVVRGWFGG